MLVVAAVAVAVVVNTVCCRRRLVVRAARCLHYDKVVVGDISSVLAARVLSFIAQGRGAQLPYELVSH